MNYIKHRIDFDQVKSNFESWLDPATGVSKAMVSMNSTHDFKFKNCNNCN